MLKSSQEPSKTLLQPGCRWESFWGAFWAPPERRKSCSRHNAGSISAIHADHARGSKIDPILVQNRSQMPPRRRPDGFQSRLQNGYDFSATFDSIFYDNFQTPGGGARGPQMVFKSVSKTCSRRGPFPDPFPTTKCTLLASKNGPRGGSSTLVAFG